MTFEFWLVEWFQIYKAPTLSKSSLQNIERVIRLHIPQFLKDLELNKIRILDIDRALSLIPSTRMKKYTHHVIFNALKKAYQVELIDTDLTSRMQPVKHKSKKSNALSHSEQKHFLERIKNNTLRYYFEFCLYSGVRRCEALSLRWEDIEEEEDNILIRGTKSVTSYRKIPITEDMRKALDGQRSLHKNDTLIFPYHPTYATQVFKANCPNHKLHDLRHTYITRCAESGINISVCQQLVGHSDVKLTLDIYTHVDNDFKHREIKKLRME